jgi:hypothetical protein
MTFLVKRTMPFAICAALGFGSIQLMRFAESKVGFVDPAIMESRCPGGKDWDLPGSSYHNGMIFDHILTVDEMPSKKLAAKKMKRGR